MNLSKLPVRRHKSENCIQLLQLHEPISIRLKSDTEDYKMHFTYCDLLYTRIRARIRKNSKPFDHYYNMYDTPPFVLYYKNKPLAERPIHYTELNIHSGETIDLIYTGLFGGILGSTLVPPSIRFYYNNNVFRMSYPPDISIQALFTYFGCEIFERNFSANPNGYITALCRGNSDSDYVPLHKSLWDCSLEMFDDCSIIIYYRVMRPNGRMEWDSSIYYRWPESDYEFDSDSTASTVDSDLSRISQISDDSFEEQSGKLPYITSLHIVRYLNKFSNTLYGEDYVKKLLEDILILVHGLSSCFREDQIDFTRILTTIITFLKLRSNKSILSMFADSKISDYIQTLISPSEESGFANALDSASNIIGMIKSGKKLKITKVMYRLGMFAMTLSLFDSVGLSLDLFGYSEFDKELLRRKHKLTGDVVLDLADGLIYLLKKGYQIILTRQIDCIYHTEDEYSQLFDDITDLKVKKIALSNPEALGFNEYWYGDKLDKTMFKLRNIIKYAGNLDKSEIRYWRSQLCELELIKNNILIAKNCSQSRECPFSLLFFASPGVGKSTLTKMTFQHLAKTHDLPTEDKFMYIRNPMAKFTDGFKSEMHTYLLDDISFKHPAANPNGDVSLDEVYMLHGTFPYIPDQAALEDKGRIPVRIKFLLGTTNVKDLNAYHYFSVPSAMQRRFPYIVEVFVKKQYQKDDGSGMLDASKADCLPDDYPDYWILKVSKIVVPKKLGALAKLELLHTFEDINFFTAWLSEASINHFDNERIMTTSFTNMRTVPICKTCFRNTKRCICMQEQSGYASDSAMSWFTYWIALFLYYLYRHLAFILFDRTYWSIRNSLEFYLERWDYQCINEFVRRKKLLDIAHSARRKIGYPEAFGMIATVLVSFYAIFRFRRTIAGTTFVEQSQDIQPEEKEKEQELEYKRTDFRPPAPGKFEKELTWVANDKKLCTLDLTPQILSSTQHSRVEFNQNLSRNVIRLIIYDKKDPKQKFINNALVLKSNVIVCNAHFFNNLNSNKFQMILICDELGDGVNDKIEIKFDKTLIHFDYYRDIAIFVIHSLVPRRDVTNYFAKRGVYTEATGTLIGRDPRSGVVQYNTVHGVTLQDNYSDTWGSHPYKGSATFGKSILPTIDGDCGSVLVAHSPKGHFIASFHRAGNADNIVIGVLLYYEDIQELLKNVEPLAVSAGTPKLADNHKLQSLHPKSVFNYIEEGTAIVYGSISDYKTNQKSRVCATPMRKYLVEHENYPVDYCAPQLKGYKPHYLAAKDLVKPTTDFDEHILRACAESFLEDIYGNVPEEDITNLVHKYDLFTAVNGAAGVAFVDSVNRSTSTGYPHCTTKRRFLRALPPTRGLQDPVEFIEEFTEEVDRIIDEYMKENRIYAVFKETLKDEAVSHAKYLLGKTRAFGSAPICFVLVQRMFFLASVRLIQTHKMAFECAVGVIATTREWELFHRKLNRFTKKFAGDFKKFDKQMCPLVILLAYWILIQINMKSGNFTPEDVKVMFGIATDTAYPFMLFNGDFVQFFGSNPSGQSLTVIINSLVNCIYLRYVYVILYMENVNDGKSYFEIARTFKDHVELFVYGDDNQASTDLEWFNFKNIQRVFASVGITYTPPTKDDSTYDFMTIDEVDFLKRTYKYDPDLDAIVAPLAEDSLNKMLTTWVASDSVSPEVQGLSTIASAIREYFFHGREKFEEKRAMFIRLLKHLGWEHGINTTILPTYEMLVERYNESSDKILARLPQHSFRIQSGILYKLQDNLTSLFLELFHDLVMYFLLFGILIMRIFIQTILIIAQFSPFLSYFYFMSGKVMADVNMAANADDTQQLIYIIFYFAHYLYLGYHFIDGLSILLVCGRIPDGHAWKLKLFPLFLIIHICSAELALVLTFALIRLRLV